MFLVVSIWLKMDLVTFFDFWDFFSPAYRPWHYVCFREFIKNPAVQSKIIKKHTNHENGEKIEIWFGYFCALPVGSVRFLWVKNIIILFEKHFSGFWSRIFFCLRVDSFQDMYNPGYIRLPSQSIHILKNVDPSKTENPWRKSKKNFFK